MAITDINYANRRINELRKEREELINALRVAKADFYDIASVIDSNIDSHETVNNLTEQMRNSARNISRLIEGKY